MAEKSTDHFLLPLIVLSENKKAIIAASVVMFALTMSETTFDIVPASCIIMGLLLGFWIGAKSYPLRTEHTFLTGCSVAWRISAWLCVIASLAHEPHTTQSSVSVQMLRDIPLLFWASTLAFLGGFVLSYSVARQFTGIKLTSGEMLSIIVALLSIAVSISIEIFFGN